MTTRERRRYDLEARRVEREASAWAWIDRAYGRSEGTDPVAYRGPGYSVDPHADGNERADDVITVLQPDGTLIHAPIYQHDGTRRSQ